jgi:hypothetical protein
MADLAVQSDLQSVYQKASNIERIEMVANGTDFA